MRLHAGMDSAGEAAEDFARRLASKLPQAAGKAVTTAPVPAPRPGNAAAARKPTRASRRREAAAIRRQESGVLAMVQERRFLDALPLAREMTERFPEHGAGWKILAAMLWAAGPPEDALAAMHASVRLLPQDAEAHCNLGTALNKLRRLDEAEQWLRHALQIDPNFAPAHPSSGTTSSCREDTRKRRPVFAARSLWTPAMRSNDSDVPYAGLLFMMNHNPAVSADALFEEHCRVGAYWDRSARQSPAARTRNDNQPDRCLQVGFVSADLRNHAVASFIEPVLREWRDKDSLRITVYYNHPTDDDVSRRLRGYVSRWFPVFGLSNLQLAQKIAA